MSGRTVSGIKKRARRNLDDIAAQRRAATEQALSAGQQAFDRMTGQLNDANSALARTQADLAKTKEELAADKRALEAEIEKLKAQLATQVSATAKVQSEVISTITSLSSYLPTEEGQESFDPASLESMSTTEAATALVGTLSNKITATVSQLVSVAAERDDLKVELLESEEYVDKLHDRIDKDTACIADLEEQLKDMAKKAERVTSSK